MRKTQIQMYFLFFFAAAFLYAAFVLNFNVDAKYLALIAPGFVFAFFAYLAYRKDSRLKLLIKLRQAWGKEQPNKRRDFSAIASLFQQAPQPPGTVDERTWQDLNMDLLFAKMDHTLTSPGQQSLYRILRTPELNQKDWLEKRKEIITAFQNDTSLREEVQIALTQMDARIGEGLATLIWGTPKIKPVHPFILYQIMLVVAVLSPLALLFNPRGSLLILVVFQINMYLHFKVQKVIRSHFEAVRSLRQLIAAGRRLTKLSGPRYEPLRRSLSDLKRSLQAVGRFTNVTRNVGLESTDPFLNVGMQYAAIFFLSEVRGFYRALRFIEAKRRPLQTLQLVVGEIDALLAVASYRESLPYYCQPVFRDPWYLRSQDFYHPLVENPVSNSVLLTKKEPGILVTGSNMSGKSTFLRAMGLNALLAQTIVTCHARAYQTGFLQLLTCIGRADNVVEGKSYYLEEALGIRRVLDALTKPAVTLAIFDEMFRGTNSEERILAGYRVLKYIIHQGALVLVATHDLELAAMLDGRYRNNHFRERVGSLGLEFDYKLKEGPSTTKNAIALLRHLGYPPEITDPGSG